MRGLVWGTNLFLILISFFILFAMFMRNFPQ